MSFIISGSVTSSLLGTFESGVTMSFFSESVLVATASTDASGQYTASFSEATWSGYSEPTHSEFVYSTPPTRSYSLVSTDQTDEDFNLYRFVSGSGVDGDEYLIYTADELNMVRYEGSASFELANDIDLSSIPDWEPINLFSGSFDGNGKIIENLTITTLGQPDSGFFGRINFASGFRAIKNVTLNSASVFFTSGNTSDQRYIGGLVSRMNIGNSSDFSNNKIKNSKVGLYFGLTTNSSQDVGGLIGEVNSSGGSMTSCSVENTTIIRKSTGGQIAQADIGGFIGFSNRPMSHCFVNNCIIEAERKGIWAHIAGFSGHMSNLAATSNCYVANTLISSSAGELLSGFAAIMDGTTANCYAAVTYSGYDDIADINPFYSEILSGVENPANCYFDSGTVDPGHAPSSNVTPLTTAEMKDETSYNNWDFQDVWVQEDFLNNGYPYLNSQEFFYSISGNISSSLDIAQQDVTMSFNQTPVFYSASLLAIDTSSPYSQSIILPPNKKDDILIISVLVGAAVSDIWAPDCESIAKVTGSQLNAEWFWKRVTSSQDTQLISSSANNLYGVATVWRGCVATGSPYLEPVVTLGQIFDRSPVAASVTASEDNTLLVSFANIEDQWTYNSGFPPTGWSTSFNYATQTGTDVRLSGIFYNGIPISGSGTEQVDFGLLQTSDYWATLTLLLRNDGTSSNEVTYTDSDGNFTQSLASGFQGKLSPVFDGYEFFDSPGSIKNIVPITVEGSDITEDFIGVKDFTSGSGFIDNPYTIFDHEDMHNVRYRPGENAVGFFACYHLGGDIDLSPISEWKTINAYSTDFFGYFRGNNYTISNMNISVIEDATNQNYFGLFGNFNHTASLYCGDVNFNSCSIDLTDGLAGTVNRYYGIFIANSEFTNTVKNVHVRNSIVSHNRTGGDSANNEGFLGGIVGRLDGQMTSCSVEGTTVHYNTTVTTTGIPASGMLVAVPGSNQISYCYVKSSSLFTNRNASTTNAGLIAGGSSPYIRDCYALNSEVSGAQAVTAVASGFNASSARIYVAGINYGNTAIDDRWPVHNSVSFGEPAGSVYWETGINTFTNGTGSGTNTYSASSDELKSIRHMSETRGTTGFDFENIWAKNDQFQDGYPFLYWEAPTVTSSSVEGLISSSIFVPIEDVTMSFHNEDGIIDYTASTDSNGAYTQSIDSGWSGSIHPTASAGSPSAEFFRDFNDTGSFFITNAISDKIFDDTSVKDFSSGSSTLENPYIILDHEDFTNMRWRTNSQYYKLGDDIDLSYFANWVPIPDYNTQWTCDFDGNNKTISNMTMTSISEPAASTNYWSFGIFGRTLRLNSGIKDVTLDSCSVILSSLPTNITLDLYGGIFCGQYVRSFTGNNKMRNIHLRNSVLIVSHSGGSINDKHLIGGIVGMLDNSGGGEVAGNALTSCSVEDSFIKYDVANLGSTSFGGLFGKHTYYFQFNESAFAFNITHTYNYIKDTLLYFNKNNATGFSAQFGCLGGSNDLRFDDCYVLNCLISGTADMAPISHGWEPNRTTRCYAAQIDYGSTPIENRFVFNSEDDDSAGFNYWESGSLELVNTSSAQIGAGVTGSTTDNMKISSSYITWDFENIWVQDVEDESGTSGLTTHYDSRISYVSASNTWEDLISHTSVANSGYPYFTYETITPPPATDAISVNTFPSGGHLYFGTEFGSGSASFSNLIVSNSFGVEMFIAPTTESAKMSLFSTTSGSFPRIDCYISESNVYFGFQGKSSDDVTYMSSSFPLNTEKFNHVAFQVAPDSGTLWVNGTFEPSMSFEVGSSGWSGGTIGVLDTEQTNQYYGYIDIFKVWNAPPFDSTEQTSIDTYHVSRSYFTGFPGITYPSP